MTKKVAVINDLSGLGRCSLTAAISVLSAMGIQACPLPTAILSSQTEYPSYYCYDFTDKMDYFRQEWKKLGTCFSGIYTGYIASVPQIEEIFHFLDTFQTPDTFLLVDPVMGDDGMTYDMYTSEFLSAMKELTARADDHSKYYRVLSADRYGLQYPAELLFVPASAHFMPQRCKPYINSRTCEKDPYHRNSLYYR